MKRILILLLIMNFLFLISCEQVIEAEISAINDLETQDEAVELMALAIAKAMNNVEFRELIRYETNKQFDYDYDVLYRFIKDHELAIEGVGSTKVSKFLIGKIEQNIKETNVNKDYLKNLHVNIPNLNICVPFQYKNWNANSYTPKVVALPVNFSEDNEKLNIYDASGNKIEYFVKLGMPEKPVITIGISERVDEDGFLLVNENHFVIDKNKRNILADEAYENSSSLKSMNLYDDFVKVIDGEVLDSLARCDSINKDLKSTYILPKITDAIVTELPQPKFTKAHPHVLYPGSVHLQWSAVTGATEYEIKMQTTGENISSLIGWQTVATISTSQPLEYIRRWMWVGTGFPYYFAVRAKNSDTNQVSQFSPVITYFAGWRKGIGDEILKSLRIDNTVWKDIEFFLSKIELKAQVAQFDISDKSVDYPSTGLGQYEGILGALNLKFPVGEKFLEWDLTKYSPRYYVYLIETDPGEKTTHTIGAKLFLKDSTGSGGEASYTVAFDMGDNDKIVGWLKVDHYDRTLGWNGEGVALPTESGGNARIWIDCGYDF